MNTPPRKKRNSNKVNLVISAVFHSLVIGALFFLAAREGMLGTKLKTIAVQMAKKEKPPEKKEEAKKEEPKPEPKLEQPKAQPKTVPAPKVAAAPRTPPPSTAPPPVAPPAAAPPPVSLGGFNFTDDSAKVVQSSSDPVLIYKGYIEYALRAKWRRPEGVVDDSFVAEVDLSIDVGGRITGSDLRKGSGDNKWDDSVRRAIQQTGAFSRPPPKSFPPKVLVRFDTQPETEPLTTSSFTQP